MLRLLVWEPHFENLTSSLMAIFMARKCRKGKEVEGAGGLAFKKLPRSLFTYIILARTISLLVKREVF